MKSLLPLDPFARFHYNTYEIQTGYFSKNDTTFQKHFFICPYCLTIFLKDYFKIFFKKRFYVCFLLHRTLTPFFFNSNRNSIAIST